MRYFPSAARQHVAALLVGILSVAVLTLPLAHADDEGDLEQRRRDVKGQIAHTADNLRESSREAARVSRLLERTQGRLDSARTRLGNVETRLGDARAVEERLQGELVEARAALVVADLELEQGKADVADQRLEVRDSILRLYAYGDPQLRALGAFFDNATLEDLQRQDVADKVIVGRGSQQLSAYELAELRLATQQEKVEAARDTIATKRSAAERQVNRIARLFVDARDTESRILSLVGSNRAARAEALRIQAADRARLKALEAREAAIADRLVRLARREAARQALRGGGFNGSSGGFLDYPTNGPITSPYGYRTHPIYGYYGLHNGTDFGVACGQSLFASATGTVLNTYEDDVYGKRLFLNVGIVNGKSLVLIYNHLSGYRVSQGQRVQRGDVVGTAGSTGWSTGCHLHFTVMADGKAVDPATYL
ncbi:MAG: peptidoglycan DD-metalloendopeptidase family protein [Nocardioides sp.]